MMKMYLTRFLVLIVLISMLMPAVALAHSHLGYISVTVTPTTPVAPGDTVTVEFEYKVDITNGDPQYSLWEVRLDGVTGDRFAPAAVLVSGTKPVSLGENTLSVIADVTITVPKIKILALPK